MGGSQKAPPRERPRPLPRAVRVYAHLQGGFTVACPSCQIVNVIRKARYRTRRVAGYDALRGVLVCRGCQRQWYVGIVLWAVTQGARMRPGDTVPTAEEARQIREDYGTGWGKVDAPPVRVRGNVNLVCWCGAECPAHPKGDEDESE